MRKNNYISVVIILIVVFVFIFIMMAMVNKRSGDIAEGKTKQTAQDLIAEISDKDYMLYYVGQPSQELLSSGINMTVIPQSEMNPETLPVFSYSFDFTEYDEDGNIVQHEEARDYPVYMLIYVDSTIVLDETGAELLRNCAVDNHVPLIIEGKSNIEAFRAILLLSEHVYEESDTMMFTQWGGSSDHVIDQDALTGRGDLFLIQILQQIKSVIEGQDSFVAEVSESIASSVSESAEEAAETAAETSSEDTSDDQDEEGDTMDESSDVQSEDAA